MKVSFFEGCVEKQKGIMTKIEFVIFQKSAHRISNLVNWRNQNSFPFSFDFFSR